MLKEIELTLFESIIPGELLGKEVIDAEARRVGIVRGIKIRYPPLKAALIIRGKELEIDVPIEYIEQVGKTVVKMKKRIELDEITAEDVIILTNELKKEIATELKIGHDFSL